MFREATHYCQQFKAVVRKLARMTKNYSDLTSTAEELLESRIPRLYKTEPDGTVVPEFPDSDTALAKGLQTRKLAASSQSMQQRMEEEILSNFETWFGVYENCKVALNELVDLKFELDSRQRTVISLDYQRHSVQDKIEKEASEGEQTSSSRDLELKNTAAKLEHKEEKRMDCLNTFQRKDAELNQQLRALLTEVCSVTELIGEAYQILRDGPHDVCVAFHGQVSHGVQTAIPITEAHIVAQVKQTAAVLEEASAPNPFLKQE